MSEEKRTAAPEVPYGDQVRIRREKLAQLQETMDSEDQRGEIIYQPVGADAVSGTLSLSNVESGYEEGGPNAEYNEGAIGGMSIWFTVNGNGFRR